MSKDDHVDPTVPNNSFTDVPSTPSYMALCLPGWVLWTLDSSSYGIPKFTCLEALVNLDWKQHEWASEEPQRKSYESCLDHPLGVETIANPYDSAEE